MKVTKKPLAELHPPERNVRMHTDKQLKEFRRSVEMFGQIRPIVVDEGGTILAGNGLFETLLSIHCVRTDGGPEEKAHVGRQQNLRFGSRRSGYHGRLFS